MKSWKNRKNSAFECSFSPLFGRQFSAILSEEEGLPGESSYNWEKNGALGIMRTAMSQKKTDPLAVREYPTAVLIRRFLPYYKGYLGTLFLDLACAVLTCGAELVLPMIIRYLTNTAIENAALLSVKIVAELALLYFLLCVVDTLAAFYMAYQGHVMGTHIETDCGAMPIII